MPSLLPTKTLRSAAGEPENTKDTERAFGGKKRGVGRASQQNSGKEKNCRNAWFRIYPDLFESIIFWELGRDLNRV